MNIYEPTEYDLCRSALLECVMSDMEWEELYTIIEHAETAFEFDVSVQAQVELNQVVGAYYGWENEGNLGNL
jgi:hypothetical protein